MKKILFLIYLSVFLTQTSHAANYCFNFKNKKSWCYSIPEDCHKIKEINKENIISDDRTQLLIAKGGCVARETGQATRKKAEETGKWLGKNAAPVTEFFKGLFD